MTTSIEELLGIKPPTASRKKGSNQISFSFLFFSDVRKDVTDKQKYEFVRDITVFADRAGFTAIYLPERHFYEFGSIFANSAVMASYLIPQTTRIRFRTAGISLPLHHPAEIVEWWAMNDILSGGRVDLGFGSGWNKPDFIYAPEKYTDRRQICSDWISLVQKLWRGETVNFPGPDGELIPIAVYPRPLQKELNVWLLVTKNDDGFLYAGRQGYNVFTMLYGNSFEAMGEKIALYRQGREEAGYDPKGGIVTLMLHTLVHESRYLVHNAVELPFKAYIKSSLDAHVQADLDERGVTNESVSAKEKAKILDYAYQRYVKTAAIFGTVDDARKVVDEAIAIGVNDIACLVDFGVDYSLVKESLSYLGHLISHYSTIY
jgi:natural product biosynthesis luciferase-like monooxygenase protein